jgi:hypothetical protein
VLGLDHDEHTSWLERAVDRVGDLRREPFLDLEQVRQCVRIPRVIGWFVIHTAVPRRSPRDLEGLVREMRMSSARYVPSDTDRQAHERAHAQCRRAKPQGDHVHQTLDVGAHCIESGAHQHRQHECHEAEQEAQ